ncbi:MAG TPA: SCO family protein, partial [Afipia sp.]|nr:SCO family protein [Afipia sp.]
MAALLFGVLTVSPASAQGSTRSAAELMDAVMWNREPIGGA